MFGGELLRMVTPRLPKSLLLKASKVAIPLYHVHRLPLVGWVTVKLLPTSINPDPEWRWLDTFDWYSPTLPVEAHVRGGRGLVQGGGTRRHRA